MREIVMANRFGAGFACHSFLLGFRIPNLTRDLFAEGALSSAFIPSFATSLMQQDKLRANELANLVTSAIIAIVGFACSVCRWPRISCGCWRRVLPASLENLRWLRGRSGKKKRQENYGVYTKDLTLPLPPSFQRHRQPDLRFRNSITRPTSAAVYASRVFGGVIGGAPMLEDDLPGFLGFVRFRLSHRPSRLGTHPRQSRIQRLPRPSRLLPFNFTPEQTKLFDRMLRYKTPPNAASSANSA